MLPSPRFMTARSTTFSASVFAFIAIASAITFSLVLIYFYALVCTQAVVAMPVHYDRSLHNRDEVVHVLVVAVREYHVRVGKRQSGAQGRPVLMPADL